MPRTITILIGLGAAATAGAELPDPTRPYDYVTTVEVQEGTASAGTDWRLTGIRIRGEDRAAIINGRVVRAGDDLFGAKVVEIGHGEVVLDEDQKRIVLKLLLSTVKHPAGAAGAGAGAN